MKPELLSPVGNIECLMAAINAGCDAVYLSGKNFGARSFASNFSNDELIDVIKKCHLYGVKVYVTANTLIYDNEVEEFINYIDFLHKNNVDAVIMQDIGMIDLVRKTYPNLEIHASTQLHIHNLEGVKLISKLGIKRAVLARETPIELVKEIKESTNVELEIFVHGALCMSYSGQCLMSALIGNRSGNRGTCAQVCRQPYDFFCDNKKVNKDKYLLSTKDLNTLEHIGELIDIGVDSLKIEGRMKRPEYVYLVTSLYRKAIDNYLHFVKTMITKEDILNLTKMFNRKFTKGFLFSENNNTFTNTYRPNHIGIEIGNVLEYKNGKATVKLNDSLSINDGIRVIGKNDTGEIVTIMYKNGKRINDAFKGDIIVMPLKETVNKLDVVLKTTDYKLINNIDDLIKINKKINIKGNCIIKKGSKIELIISDYKNEIKCFSDYIVEEANSNPTDLDTIKKQLNKLGNTIYSFNNLNIDFDDDVFIPINVLNDLRRKVINILNEKREYKIEYKKEKYDIEVHNFPNQKNKNILIHTYEEYLDNKDDYDIIYVDNIKDYHKINDNKCVLKIPRVQERLNNYNTPLLVGELGSVYKYRCVDTDFSLNVVNSYSVAFLHSLGVNKITLSYELNYSQIKFLIDSYINRYKAHPNLEVIISGYEEAMICKYKLPSNGYLIDKFKNKFKIEIKDNLMYIYNYKKRDMKENYFDIGINNVRINL